MIKKQLDLNNEYEGSLTFDYFEETNIIRVSMFEDYHYVGEFIVDSVAVAKLVDWIKNEVDHDR